MLLLKKSMSLFAEKYCIAFSQKLRTPCSHRVFAIHHVLSNDRCYIVNTAAAHYNYVWLSFVISVYTLRVPFHTAATDPNVF